MRSKLTKPVMVVIFLLCFAATSFAQSGNAPQTLEQTRINRLTELAKVWGAVKFFHPYLATREIDWDQALIVTIPKVNAARTSEEFKAALNGMLAVLRDKSTYADREKQPPPAAATTSKPATGREQSFVRLQEGMLIIEAAKIIESVMQENSQAPLNQSLTAIQQALAQAKGLIWDCRQNYPVSRLSLYTTTFANWLQMALPRLLDTNIMLATSRYRTYSGYPSQVGTSSGGYSAGLAMTAPALLTGQSKTPSLPMVFLLNDKTPDLAQILSGLQTANRALLIQEGMPEEGYGASPYPIGLSEGLLVNIRTSELVNSDGRIGLEPDIVVAKSGAQDAAMEEAFKNLRANGLSRPRSKGAASDALQSDREKPYAEMDFPTTEYRLLALFRFWNIIHYFFPYKNLIDESWDNILPRYIPKFEANQDAADYQLTVREMVAEIQDSHGGFRSPNRKSSERLGDFYPPVVVKLIEKQTVITEVFEANPSLQVGDVIVTMDDEPVAKRRERFGIYVAASTPQAWHRSLDAVLLRGQKDSQLNLTVRGADGQTRQITITRTLANSDPKRQKALAAERKLSVFGVLPSGFGYVDLARLQRNEVDKMFDTIMKTPATIFDMRGYPNGTAWLIAPRLTDKAMPVAALFSRPLYGESGLAYFHLSYRTQFTFSQTLPPNLNGEVYKGKVVVLINEDAVSQAEHTCLFFEAATDVTFIGTPTAGANGDVTATVLPGNIVVGFTGHDVRHADGRQLQRVGIQPHIRVEPTIRSIIENRDEILDAAIRFLQKQHNQ